MSGSRHFLSGKRILLLGLTMAVLTWGGSMAEAVDRTPSAIGTENVLWIAISPAYLQTGFAVVVSARVVKCVIDCTHLWVTHDRGASWKRAKGTGFTGGMPNGVDLPRGGRPVIAVDFAGHETMFSQGSNVLERSEDGGETWTEAGPTGHPTPIPGTDGAVAVAGTGGADYVLRDRTIHPVPGSGGTLEDAAFAFPSAFPSSVKYSPALLVGSEKESGRPVIQQCNSDLLCSGSTSLLGSVKKPAVPPALWYSSSFAQDGVVFAQTGGVVYKSKDGGATFKALKVVNNNPTASAAPMMALATNYREAGPVRAAYLALFQVFEKTLPNGMSDEHNEGGIYKTADGGKTWLKVGFPGPFDQGASAVAVAPDGRLFAGYLQSGKTSGLLCSTDEKTWRASCGSGRVIGPPVNAEAANAKTRRRGLNLWAIAVLAVVVLGGPSLVSVIRKRREAKQT
jgi:photosystem II stability/assembly factor-like uncharacterized protein